MSILWYIALMLFGGLLFGRLAKFVKLPNVTGYLLAGLILGPYVLRFIPAGTVGEISIIADVALGFIAFTVGSEFKMSYIKRVGMTPIVIACMEAFGAALFVTVAVYLFMSFTNPAAGFNENFSFALMLGAIASATAPAATIMVIRQYKAKGPVTETLLTVVALDDAAALMLFGIATAIAQQLTIPGVGGSVLSSIGKPIYQIVGSLLLGAVLGLLFTFPLRFFKKSGNRLSITIGMVFLAVALATWLDLSALLVCMAMGALFCNVSSQSGDVMKVTDNFTPPILMLFFVLSGAELDVTILPAIGLVGIIYVVVRVLGKFCGAFTGAKVMKAPPAVAKFLGPALIPQAGVAIGLSLIATQLVPGMGAQIRAIILCGTLIYEIIGPVITKISLTKAGEIKKST